MCTPRGRSNHPGLAHTPLERGCSVDRARGLPSGSPVAAMRRSTIRGSPCPGSRWRTAGKTRRPVIGSLVWAGPPAVTSQVLHDRRPRLPDRATGPTRRLPGHPASARAVAAAPLRPGDRPAGRSPVPAPAAPRAGHRPVRGARRGRQLAGRRHVRPGQGELVRPFPGVAERDPVARLVWPAVRRHGPGRVPGVLRRWDG
jgi:hypothetical protein